MRSITCAAAALLATGPAFAQMAHQFELIGPIEHLAVDDLNDPLSRATITVHGVEAVLPKNLIVQMPARYLTPADIVNLNPAAPGTNSGLALDDAPPPLAAFEATVVGNIVGGEYRAGLVWISQHSLATGAGFISEILSNGEIHLVADPDVASTTPTRVRINDPKGVFAPPDTEADPRFKVDEENPTVHAGTGYPMCIVQPATAAEPNLPDECPTTNRPNGPDNKPLTTFVMGTTGLPGSPAGAPDIPPCPVEDPCDQTRQAPLMIGDFITYAGTLAEDAAGSPYISAHTVEANVGIYTAPGVDPAYISIEGSLIGTQGPLVDRDPATPGVTFPQETQDRLKIEGVTTDPSRAVELYAIDVDAAGAPTLRLFNTVPAQPAPLGRFRLILGSRANALFESGTDNLRGAPRELMARVAGPTSLEIGGCVTTLTDLDGKKLPEIGDPCVTPVAHGLVPRQYVAPFGEFIFPENKVIGDPILRDNFECLPFLLLGSGPLETTDLSGPPVGPLDPWPDVGPKPTEVNCGVRPKPV